MLKVLSVGTKFYHLGFSTTVNLGNANDKRYYRIFEGIAYILIDQAGKTCYNENFEIDVVGNVYALDSITVDLCMSIFWWAKFRSTKGGIKIHTLFDAKTSRPAYLYISEAKLHDENAVKVQIYCAIIAYCLVAICGNELQSKRRIYEILQIFSISLFDKTPINEMITKSDYKNNNELYSNQLKFCYF